MIVNRLGSTLFHVAKREIATSLPTRVRSFHSAKQKKLKHNVRDKIVE